MGDMLPQEEIDAVLSQVAAAYEKYLRGHDRASTAAPSQATSPGISNKQPAETVSPEQATNNRSAAATRAEERQAQWAKDRPKTGVSRGTIAGAKDNLQKYKAGLPSYSFDSGDLTGYKKPSYVSQEFYEDLFPNPTSNPTSKKSYKKSYEKLLREKEAHPSSPPSADANLSRRERRAAIKSENPISKGEPIPQRELKDNTISRRRRRSEGRPNSNTLTKKNARAQKDFIPPNAQEKIPKYKAQAAFYQKLFSSTEGAPPTSRLDLTKIKTRDGISKRATLRRKVNANMLGKKFVDPKTNAGTTGAAKWKTRLESTDSIYKAKAASHQEFWSNTVDSYPQAQWPEGPRVAAPTKGQPLRAFKPLPAESKTIINNNLKPRAITPEMKSYGILSKVNATADNFGTGLRLAKGPSLAIGALAVVGMGLAAAIGSGKEDRQAVMSRGEDAGGMNRLAYDAQGMVSNGSRDLGATGDLVFGLSKSRKGGQL